MIYEGKGYFSYPGWCDQVYCVSLDALKLSAITVLPDETELQLTLDGDWIEVNKTSSRNRQGAKRIKAEFVFDARNDPPTPFSGKWEDHFRLMNIAAATNVVYFVTIPQKEFERLEASKEREFEALKKKLSPRAAEMLLLFGGDDDCYVEVCHTGSCP